MHDLDRTMYEMGPHEVEAHRAGEWEQGEGEQTEEEDFLGVLGSILGETHGEHQETPELHELHEMLGVPSRGAQAGGQSGGGYGVGSSQEMHELQLASELLEVTSEEELDRFLGDLISGVAKTAGDFVRSDTGRALGNVLRSTAKAALPVVGAGIGGQFGPRGEQWGRRAGTATADLFGLELEGLSSEDREFELARAFIRFAQAACRNAAKAPPDAPPSAVVRAAVTAAARRHAPGLLPLIAGRRGGVPGGGVPGGGRGAEAGEPARGTRAPTAGGPAPQAHQVSDPAQAPQSGRWVRRDGAIVLLGA